MQNPAVDAYIARQAPFARPILAKIRALFHKAVPDLNEEMKWGCPHFVRGRIVGSMAGFKAHASYGFWQAQGIKDARGLLEVVGRTDMAAPRDRIASVEDLPPDAVLLDYIRQAAALAAQPPPSKPKAKPRPEAEVPDELRVALSKNAKARAAFQKFPPSHRREYIEWVTQAKQAATRVKRIETAVAWMADGKSRHWKYEKQ